MTPPVTGGSPDREARGQRFMCYPRNPRNGKSFCPDTRPGGPVTGATRQSFMCWSFMCLFCSLENVRKRTCGQGLYFEPSPKPPVSAKSTRGCLSAPGKWGRLRNASSSVLKVLNQIPVKVQLKSGQNPLKSLMRCAEGIFAKGILGCTGFSLLRWERGSETPFCDGEKGLRLPRSLGRSMRERGSLRPFSPSQEGVSDPLSHRKRQNPVHPKIPLAKIPLAQRINHVF